jgi:hypothetical protein
MRSPIAALPLKATLAVIGVGFEFVSIYWICQYRFESLVLVLVNVIFFVEIFVAVVDEETVESPTRR